MEEARFCWRCGLSCAWRRGARVLCGVAWRLDLDCGREEERMLNKGAAMTARNSGVYGVMERKSKGKSCWKEREGREGALPRLPSSWAQKFSHCFLLTTTPRSRSLPPYLPSQSAANLPPKSINPASTRSKKSRSGSYTPSPLLRQDRTATRSVRTCNLIAEKNIGQAGWCGKMV